MSASSAPAAAPFEVLILTVPAGELKAAARVLAELPTSRSAAVPIVMSGDASEAGATLDELRRPFPDPIRAVEHGLILEAGGVYVAPPDLLVDVQPGLRCAVSAPDARSPARRLDQLLASLALSVGPATLVVLLGEGADGVAGARALRGVGGTGLVQRQNGTPQTALAQTAMLVLSSRNLALVVAELLEGGGAAPDRPDVDPQLCEATYYALFSEMDQAYAVVEVLADAAGRWVDFLFLSVNRAFMRHTGMPYPVGRTATALLGTPNPRWAELYGQVAETGEPMRVEEGELTLGRTFDLNIFRLGGEGSRRVAVLFTDITGRRQAEEAVRSSERRYRLLFENMGEGFALAELIWDETGQPSDWRYLEVNDAWAQTDVPVSGAVGRTAREVNPLIEPGWIETYARVVQTGQPARYTAYAAGFGRWFETTAFRHSDNRFGVVFRDVTERKRREANQAFMVELSRELSQARTEEDLLRAVGGGLAAHLGLSCFHYVDVNEDLGEVTVRHFWHAQDVPTVLGTHSLAGFISPDQASRLRAGELTVSHDVTAITGDSPATAGLRAGAAAQKIGAYVAVPYSQDGRWRAYFAVADRQPRPWTELELELIRDVAHRLFPQVERVRAATALTESEGRLRALIGQLPGSAVFVVNRDLRYVLAQGEALSAAGYRPEDLVGRTVAQAMPTALVGEYEAHYRLALTGVGFEYEHEAHGRAFITRGVPLSNGGGGRLGRPGRVVRHHGPQAGREHPARL